MAHELGKLPYAYDALEPHMDAKTVEIHHDKHHQGYVNKLNAALEKHPELFEKSLEDLLKDLNAVPEDIRTAVRNNGGGHANHNLYWETMGPNCGGEPSGELAEAIKRDFGGFEAFKEKYGNAAKTQFASGWAWLAVNNGKLEVFSTPNHDTPLSKGMAPILCVDVWEHSYYLRYQNRRPEFVDAYFNLINWAKVEELYKKAL
jgi:superoxide dismutase, Fe-Mn family